MDRKLAGQDLLLVGRQRAYHIPDELSGEVVQVVPRVPIVERSHGRVAAVDKHREGGQRILQLGECIFLRADSFDQKYEKKSTLTTVK